MIPHDLPLRRICVVMMSAIGDAVHVLPVLTAIKRHAPASHITWVLQPGPAALVRGHPAVDEIILFEKKQGWRAFRAVRRELSGRAFDLVLGLQVYFKAGLVTSFTRAAVRLGFDRARARDLNWLVTTHRIPPHEPQHVQDQYFEFLHVLGIDPEPIEWQLGPWEHERPRQRELVGQIGAPFASLVIGSTVRQREWIADRWAELSDALFESHGLRGVLVGGRSPRELETEARIRARARHPPHSTLGVSLRDLVGVIDASDLVISLDTAPQHIAVALGRPIVSLIGHTNPKRTGPYRGYPQNVVDAFGDPGEDYPVSHTFREGRMERITVEDVMAKVDAVLAEVS
jgi:heptosyltransferase I